MLNIPDNEPLKIYTDGATRGRNPGPSALAFIFIIGNQAIHRKSQFIGSQTNNQTEYRAVIEALKDASQLTHDTIEVFSDSELVVNQINGDYQVRSANISKLFREVHELKGIFRKSSFSHVPRDNHWISKADKLCNQCLNLHIAKT